MDLILWRHAEAHPASAGQDDLDRALTAKGERQARRMAEWLEEHLPEGTRILASPAVRAQQTARALAKRFETVPALQPDAPPEAVLQAAGWPDGEGAVLVVGHQPTLGLAAAQAVSGQAQRWAMKKGAVWWLRARDREEGSGVIVQAVVSTEML